MDENLPSSHRGKFSVLHCKRRGTDGRLSPAEPSNVLAMVETKWRDDSGQIRWRCCAATIVGAPLPQNFRV